MKMKLAVAGLCFMGLIAACCAALLVNALRASASIAKDTDSGDGMVDVMFATRSLPAMTVIDASVLTVKRMSRDEAPKKFISRPADIVGKVLAAPVSDGQAFTKDTFAEEGGSRQFAAIIPPGKRAQSISVADSSGLGNLIYPGSCVDVLVTFKPQDGDPNGGLTKTLLENVQVLAIDDQTVVSPGKTVTQALGSESRIASRRFTLLVDTLQAKTLQMATQEGTLSLTLRNPMDSANGDKDSVSVSTLMGRKTAPDPFVNQTPAPMPPAPPTWHVTVIRGSSVNTESVPLAEK